MDRHPAVLYKTLVIGVIVLFIGISVVSSKIGIAEDKSSNNYFLESPNNPKDLLSCDHSAYIIGDGPNCYLYEFILNNASDLNCVCEGSCGYIPHATWSIDNYIYFTQYGSGLLFVIDIDSCEMSCIGGGGQSLNGLAYDLTTNRMFGVGNPGFQDVLYEIDPDTGEQTQIGYLGGSYNTAGIAFDSEDKLYGWDAGNDKLWTLEAGNKTIVGDLGFNINYTCDGDFCKEDDILYIVHENKLYMYDIDKEQCELIDEFPDYVSVTGLAIPYGNDDTTPPVTTHTLDPQEPDGNKDWYISDVNVTLTATDDISGVKEIRYCIHGGAEQIIPGDNGSFILDIDGDDILVEFWAIDYAGNYETKNRFYIDIDQTEPDIELTYEVTGGNWWQGWELTFTAEATDDMSGMERVEFYINDELQDTVYGPGPEYLWLCYFPPLSDNQFQVNGLINNFEITDEYVRFYAIIVRISRVPLAPDCIYHACAFDNAGNQKWAEIFNPSSNTVIIYPGIFLFQNLILPNNYTGYIGRFFIFATFKNN